MLGSLNTSLAHRTFSSKRKNSNMQMLLYLKYFYLLFVFISSPHSFKIPAIQMETYSM